jgi:hypothetical protein
MRASGQYRERPRRCYHHLGRHRNKVEAALQQKALMRLAPRCSPPLQNDAVTLVFEGCDTVDRQHQGLLIHEQRIGLDHLRHTR